MQALIFAVAVIGFYGAVRMSEILCKFRTRFEPEYTLLKRDVCINKVVKDNRVIETLTFKIKSSKTNKSGNHEIVEVMENKGECCPIRAYKRLLKFNKHLSSESLY